VKRRKRKGMEGKRKETKSCRIKVDWCQQVASHHCASSLALFLLLLLLFFYFFFLLKVASLILSCPTHSMAGGCVLSPQEWWRVK
jgi:hypothetical protein